ncbi:ATP-binding protein [Paractinoplanes globisporus]|uniref:histidine kinase n=1 Tax=Paractinoplanes globisporus TaxID=113565 RepID=A0ABW6WSR9_9ACTN|nr:ATP-binding protein [Actinoplanes globisporus]
MTAREQLPCDTAELRSLFLFEKLSDDQLEWLCRNGHVERFDPGYVYREDDLATSFYVLLDGELVISRRAGDQDVEINRTSQAGSYAGAWRSFFGDGVTNTLDNTLRTTVPSRLYVLAADKFAELMREWFPMPVHMLAGLFAGMRNTAQAVSERDRLVALSSLSAGLTHELNNPAAAVSSATAALRERIAAMRHKLGLLLSGPIDRDDLAVLAGLQNRTVEHVTSSSLSSLAASDREDELSDWLDDRGISSGWEMAPGFVQAGFGTAWLDTVASSIKDTSSLENVLGWLNATVDIELLMNELADSTARISALVTAAKQYSQLDRAPYQVVDIHELLDSTLVMLNRKIGDAITVVREYDRGLPPIPLYAAEMNQVWTNLVDNAVDAMKGQGTLTVRTSRDNDRVLVEIGDTGVGVPEEAKRRIFEPFFTTKPVGSGTGLGLDISWRIVVNRHHGDLSVESAPGNTRFMVRLPIAAAPEQGSGPG